MATRNLASNLDNTTNRVVAFFSRREDAYRALSDLKQAGFNSDQIGLAVGHEGEISGNATSTREYDSSFWQKVKDFFSGEDHHEHTDFGEVASPMGWTDDRYEYYQRGISSGGAVVTVTGDRISEARTILQRDGADLRESGFESSSSIRPGSNTEGIRPADANTARNMPAVNRNAAMAPCAWRTSRCTSSEWAALPNRDTVAIAPCTTSIRMMKMKNRISAVEQPKNPQKILRAKASRNVSRTSARVTPMVLMFMDRLHKNVFECLPEVDL